MDHGDGLGLWIAGGSRYGSGLYILNPGHISLSDSSHENVGRNPSFQSNASSLLFLIVFHSLAAWTALEFECN